MSRFQDDEGDYDAGAIAWFCGKITIGLVVGIMAVWLVVGFVNPRLKLYAAEMSKRERIAEAKAEADAENYRIDAEARRATREADRDRTRAAGLADSNAKINGSLTPEYLTFRWIEALETSGAQLIYVPVGPDGLPQLPVTEAGRAVAQGG